MSTRTWDELVAAGKRLVGGNPQWELGDLAREVDTHYGEASLERYAKEIGVNYGTLRNLKAVADAYPEFALRSANSFGVYKALAAQPDRLELVTRERPWTVEDANTLVKSRSKPKESRPRQSTVESAVVWKDERVLAWVARRMNAGANRDEIVAEAKAGSHGWPVPGTHLPQNAYDRVRAIVEDRQGQAPARGRPKNVNGKTNAKRQAELRTVKRTATKGLAELARLATEINKMCVILEDYDIRDYDLSGGTDTALLDAASIHDDLLTLSEWVDRSLLAFGQWLSDFNVNEKITKLRNTTGRTPEEAETANRLADRLERSIQARLSA